jgi:DNA-directed RNA polymerase specialized sigma24 family protein
MKPPSDRDFEQFLNEVEPSLRRALFATLGLDRGREATSEALAWAWEHWSRVKRMKNPGGFLFRV